MTISEAKEEIIRAVQAYLMKDEDGNYCIPRERQRPLLLMGGPGIGKTAILRQAAEELGISLAAYTITHHTRQSAIGLPALAKRVYDGQEVTVTEYTMSEIVAAVYDQIERSGIREGILFLDEINCVSETLAPTMLQFLQYKRFGTHEVPEGYVIVAAGNPPEYNRSVRDFDVVTLDRVRLLNVREDYPTFKRYALHAGIHGAVLSYLELKKEHFYSVKTELRGKRFATPRGWEDLSDSLKLYESLDFPVSEDFVFSFLQDREIAAEFSAYYELYRKYRKTWRISEILEGRHLREDPKESIQEDIQEELHSAPFDEKLSLISLLSSALGQEFRDWEERLESQREVFESLKRLRDMLDSADSGTDDTVCPETGMIRSGTEVVREFLLREISEKKTRLQRELDAKLIGRETERRRRKAIRGLEGILTALSEALPGQKEEAFPAVRTAFSASEAERGRAAERTGQHLTNAFAFLTGVFGEGQELVLFLTALSENRRALHFVRDTGNEAYYRYNRLLLLDDERSRLQSEVMELL